MAAIQEQLQTATRLVTSRGIQRTAVNLTLLVTGSLCLLGLALLATGLFYENYLPDQVIETPLFLQYNTGSHPYASASLATANLKSQQAYDISISLTVPRSPINTKKGNFMVTLDLLDSSPTMTSLAGGGAKESSDKPLFNEAILFTSRRPAIIPYEDQVVGLASRLIFLPYHLLVPDSRVVRLDVVMAESSVLAPHTATLPRWAYIELRAGQDLETYHASLVLTAQLHGLRWMMHHYRLFSFLLATLVFWTAELLFMLVAWLLWAYTSSGPGVQPPTSPKLLAADDVALKREEEDLSDVPRSFPTYGGQLPLVYDPGVRLAERAPDNNGLRLLDAEADDEADDDATATGTNLNKGKGDMRHRMSR